jgi:hypothetical protein
MSIEPEGWHIDVGSPSWDAEAKTFSFFLHKPGRERVLCILAMDALEQAVDSMPVASAEVSVSGCKHAGKKELKSASVTGLGWSTI